MAQNFPKMIKDIHRIKMPSKLQADEYKGNILKYLTVKTLKTKYEEHILKAEEKKDIFSKQIYEFHLKSSQKHWQQMAMKQYP